MVDPYEVLYLCGTNTSYIKLLVCKGGDNFVVNQNQCTCLAEMLEQIFGNIYSIFHHINARDNFDLLLTECFRVIERAKSLVQQCYDEKWWHAALLQIHNEEAFQDLLMDLKSCYDDIFQHSKHQWVGKVSQYRYDMSFPSVPTMRKLVDDDHCALMQRLQAIVQSTHSSFDKGLNEELAIATYLLNRYDNQRKHVNGGHVEVDARMGWGDSISLGNGAYGHVKKTTWFGLPCVKKVHVLNELGARDDTFKHEVDILAGVNHPNVMKFICCGRKRNTCFIAMELLDMSLEKLIQKLSNCGTRAPFTIQVAVDIILQIAKGMSYLHEKNVVHRDLKPANVLVHKITVKELHKYGYVNVKLADFGPSTMGNISKTMLGQGVGAILYRAPEIFPAAKQHTKNLTMEKMYAYEVDVYSFGVMCATILSGKQPFEGIVGHLLERLRSGERPWIPDDCPKALVFLINKCWSLDRTKRPKFKEICATLKELRSSILKGNVACTNQEVGKNATMFSRIFDLPHTIVCLYKNFWKRPNLEVTGANAAQHTSQIDAKSFELSTPLSLANQLPPSQVWSIHSLPELPIHFVDIDKKVSKALFQLKSTHILGIVGVGGSGKTTLAKAILHRVHQGFEATSFVTNMKDSKNVLDIQRQLLRDLEYERFILTTEEGFKSLQKIFEKKKVFVVLDDVASQEQLHALVSSTWVFANGSKIIATSRDWEDLQTTCISHTGKMHMDLFNKYQAKELFYKHAFFSHQCPRGLQFEKVVDKIIKTCHGLPLSLEVLGSYLCGIQFRLWHKVLQRLQQWQFYGSGDNEQVWRVLSISCDNLNYEEKKMFLDIACFFCRDVLKEGMQVEEALELWNCDDADLALSSLMDRSLVRVDSDGMLTMHDLLRDMGRMIACKEGLKRVSTTLTNSSMPKVVQEVGKDKNIIFNDMIWKQNIFVEIDNGLDDPFALDEATTFFQSLCDKESWMIVTFEVVGWLCIAYNEEETVIENQLQRLVDNALLVNADMAFCEVSMPYHYREFAMLQTEERPIMVLHTGMRKRMYIKDTFPRQLGDEPSSCGLEGAFKLQTDDTLFKFKQPSGNTCIQSHFQLSLKTQQRFSFKSNNKDDSLPLHIQIENAKNVSKGTASNVTMSVAEIQHSLPQMIHDPASCSEGSKESSSQFPPMFWEELYNLKRSLSLRKVPIPCEQSANLTLDQFLDNHYLHNPGAMLIAGRVQVSNCQLVQFAFKDGEGLAQVVGVGCFGQHAVVNITKSLKVQVVHDEDAWHHIWNGARTGGSSCQMLSFLKNSISQSTTNDVTTLGNLSSQRLAKQFGVGLECDSHLQSSVKVYKEGKWRRREFLILILARYLLLDELLETKFHADYVEAFEQNFPFCEESSSMREPPNLHNGGNSGEWIWTSTLWANLWNYLPGLITNVGNTQLGERRGGTSDGGQGDGCNGGDGGGDRDDNSGGDEVLPPPPPDLDLEKGGFAIVEVYPGYGGRWDNKDLVDKDLQESTITPTLKFCFQKSKQRRELNVVLCVRFDLGEVVGPKPRDEEELRFGWFHDNLRISLQSTDDDAAFLKLDHQVVDEPDISTTTMSSSSSTTSNPLHVSFEAPGCSRSMPTSFFGVMGTLGISKNLKSQTTSVVEMTSQLPNKQVLGGFHYQDKSTENKNSKLAFRYVFPSIPKERVIHDEGTRNHYMQSGLCATVTPTVQGTWHQLNMSEASPYMFHSSRRFNEILASKKKILRKGCKSFEQTYDLKLYINHAMTHIYEYIEEPQRLKGGERCNLLEVGSVQEG